VPYSRVLDLGTSPRVRGSITFDGGSLVTPLIRVLVVDDFEPFRRLVAKLLQQQRELQIICEASDGVEAVQKAEEIQPDLILLDIGLPNLNGIEAARRIRRVSPNSKILFVSQETSTDIVRGALASGGSGYVLKTDVRTELLTAINAVLGGKRFIGASLVGNKFTDAKDTQTADRTRSEVVLPLPPKNARMTRRHEAGFYSDDRSAVDDLTQFIGAALKTGHAAIVVATKLHRESLLPRLQAYGLDIGAAIEQGRYIALDATDTLSTFMLDGMPDLVQFTKLFGDLVVTASKAAKGGPNRVALFGEMCHLLWEQGNVEAAIQVEKLGKQLVRTYDVDVLCGYSLGSVHQMDSRTLQRICAEHSAVHSR
jgi:DNA-binding NarL/FixJ family response regulator